MEQIMTKKQRIVVSIVGIFLVLVTLIGITYAYFLTKIEGNTNDSSIILSTANMLLRYTDGNGLIEPDEKIIPGTVIETKTFSVENLGTDIVNNYGVYLENVVNYFERPQDLKLTLRCEIFDLENKTYLEGNCNGLTNATYPTLNTLLVTNSIDVNIRHDYTLAIEYKNELEIDQSNDMNKTIKGKVQIYDLNDSIDISGTVSNASDDDYVVIGDNLQTSRIINGKYKIVGLVPESYTITIKNDSINEAGEIVTTTKGSKTFTVEIGNELKYENDILYITDTTDNITLNITNIATELTIELDI